MPLLIAVGGAPRSDLTGIDLAGLLARLGSASTPDDAAVDGKVVETR
jgi:flotillin